MIEKKEEPQVVEQVVTQQEMPSSSLVGDVTTDGVIFAGQEDLDLLELSAAIAS